MIIDIDSAEDGVRLDHLLTQKFTDKSRQSFQQLIHDGNVWIDNQCITKPGFKLKTGQKVTVKFPLAKTLALQPLDEPLDVLYEDDDVVVINKPPGLVVHPGVGDRYRDTSLVNMLLAHCKGKLSNFNGVERPGIVHRLDKDTSGAMVIAKNPQVHEALMLQFQERTVKKHYLGLLLGKLSPTQGLIEGAIGRDPRHRQRMAVVDERKGKPAQTAYEVLDYYSIKFPDQTINASLVQFQLLTGRTHQIRVHCASIGFPLTGDSLYGNHTANVLFKKQFGLDRQFLHAAELTFELHGKSITCKAPLAKDLQKILTILKGV